MAKKKKAAAPRGNTWVGYYPRVTKDKTKYSRKEKHKKDYRRDSGSLFLLRRRPLFRVDCVNNLDLQKFTQVFASFGGGIA